ncbi:hypothetical protein L218DRAFT_390008 [Marasmius fiardii PR-910]|nr:hypothetical protein L218DRAFT_390008 [Marasmius fiardii PR-910]
MTHSVARNFSSSQPSTMLFTRQGSDVERDIYTPLPISTARTRRATLAQETPPTTTFSTPQSTLQAHGHITRVRTVSMPEQRLNMTVVSPNSTVATTPITRSPIKSSISPSRLPRYQQRPRQIHQQSVSLEIPKSSIPRISPIQTSPSTPKLPTSTIPRPVRNAIPMPLRYRKENPLVVVQHLRNLLAERGIKLEEYLHTDDLVALHDREIMERAHTLRQAQSRQGSQGYTTDDTLSVFGVTVRQTSLYASTEAIFGGYGHDLPIIIFSCVEELHQRDVRFAWLKFWYLYIPCE